MATGKEHIEMKSLSEITQTPPSSSITDPQVPHLTVVLFGSSSAVQFGDENILLGQEHPTPHSADFSQVGPKHRIISNRNVSVINILSLQEAELYLDSVDQVTAGLEENEIHVFVFVLQLRRLTDTDKVALEWLQERFGKEVLPFVMILFTYERKEESDTIIDDLKTNPVLEQLLDKCVGRYFFCSKSMNNQSEMRTLLKKIDQLVSENRQRCYTAEMYQTALKHGPDQKNIHSEQSACSLQQEKVKINQESEMKELMVSTSDTATADNRPAQQEVEQLFIRFDLFRYRNKKLTPADILQISPQTLKFQESFTEKDLPHAFLQNLLMVNYRARHVSVEEDDNDQDDNQLSDTEEDGESLLDFLHKSSTTSHEAGIKHPVHPMDLQMAVFHCSDSFLKQLIVTKLSQCQYALPLLVPNPFTKEIEFPLWTFREIKKSWTSTKKSEATSKTKPICDAETPMVAFFRLGSISSSKSQLMNSLINEKHNTFLHRHCPGSSGNRLLMDGVVEIAWYCPSGKKADHFTDCVAFCNLHGNAVKNKKQLEILTEMSTVNVVLVSDQVDAANNDILEILSTSSKPLICLLSTSNSGISRKKGLQYKIGLRNRNNSDVSKDLRKTIKECFSKSQFTFKLVNVGNNSGIRIDEDDEECQKGKEAALQIMELLKETELSKIKETYLPCQGKLWHDWSQKNKELHRLQGTNIEMQRCKKQTEMKQNREQQHNYGLTKLMELFTGALHSLAGKDNGQTLTERHYFLKLLGILLDTFTTDDLSELRHDYDKIWSMILENKKLDNMSEQMNDAQTQLQIILVKINAATFSLEHIFREMGQIYESFMSVQAARNENENNDVSSFPKLVAELIISGYPMELMDGDAAHVPVIWISAVLDEVIKILGDQRVFVLSVLGIQSSGKSTLLNAMFGLQFAVSAGRCTRGAFMQLVKVSEEMKTELKFDYILVVDTEGIQTLDLPGMSTRQHDNGLATFVVGVGNLTLINIFGENPADMQDILQIVVQAFLRMKKVRLNPSCMFVHQNVGDITARERNIEGRKNLLDNLDKMTNLAAKEEDCSAKCFSDVIAFDVQNDVRYFAQLWEGNPPMAPPNPTYCENVHELKSSFISKISPNHGMKLSEFKEHMSNLWSALLNENFVFSFRNTLEIAVYRRLENEYSKWTWTLRSAMLMTENKLQNRIMSEKSLKIVQEDISKHMKETKAVVEESIKNFFDEDRDKEILIQWRQRFEQKTGDLYSELVKGTKQKLEEVAQLKKAREEVDRKKEKYENKIIKFSKELAFTLEKNETDEDALKNKFDEVWSDWVNQLTQKTPIVCEINIWKDIMQFLSENHEADLVWERKNQNIYKNIDVLGNYSEYILNKPKELHQKDLQYREDSEPADEIQGSSELGLMVKVDSCSLSIQKFQMNTLASEENKSLSTLIMNTVKDTKAEIQEKPIAELGYNPTYISEIIALIKNAVKMHESKLSEYTLKKEFTVDLCLYMCNFAADHFAKQYKIYRESNDVRMYLESQRPQYFSIFKNYYNGVSYTAVFGEIIVNKLEPSILQAAYDQTAIDLSEKMKRDVPAFSGNRSNLEKHILILLAEEENFDNYITYIKKPKEHFNCFITNKVNDYFNQHCSEVLGIFKNNIRSKGKYVMDAVKETTEVINSNNGDGNMWLQHLSTKLQEELLFKAESSFELEKITDFDFLSEVLNTGLNNLMSKLSNTFKSVSDIKMEMFKKKPDEILIEHLSGCCWEQCPFCNATCTNTMKDHDGDHSVRFHRNCGINGWSFMYKDELGVEFCTTVVSSNQQYFCASTGIFLFKEYRKAGGEYARWNITSDNSEMPYWKWFVCRFQKDLENYYRKHFIGNGKIPDEWRDCTKDKAINSLNEL